MQQNKFILELNEPEQKPINQMNQELLNKGNEAKSSGNSLSEKTKYN